MKWAKRRAAADDSAELPSEAAAVAAAVPRIVPVVWSVVSLFFRFVGCIRFMGRVETGRSKNLPATIGATIKTMNKINRVKYRMA
jgi:hypothetical protein